ARTYGCQLSSVSTMVSAMTAATIRAIAQGHAERRRKAGLRPPPAAPAAPGARASILLIGCRDADDRRGAGGNDLLRELWPPRPTAGYPYRLDAGRHGGHHRALPGVPGRSRPRPMISPLL